MNAVCGVSRKCVDGVSALCLVYIPEYYIHIVLSVGENTSVSVVCGASMDATGLNVNALSAAQPVWK